MCPVSGLMLGVEESYTMKPEQQHWKRVKTSSGVKTPDSNHHLPSSAAIQCKCEYILDTLLFGKERARINNDVLNKQTEHMNRQLAKEVAQTNRARSFTFQPALEFIRANTYAHSNKKPYVILNAQEHQEQVQQCIHAVTQLWLHLLGPFYTETKLYKHVPNAPFRPNIECVIVAMLYAMKTGSVNGLIPQNEFLNEHLPREKDLPVFHKDGARHLKSSKDLLVAYMDEACRLKMIIQYDEYVPKRDEDHEEVPTVRGFWCKKCRHRFDVEVIFKTHEPCNDISVPKRGRKKAVETRPETSIKPKNVLQRKHERDVKRAQKLDRELDKRMKKHLLYLLLLLCLSSFLTRSFRVTTVSTRSTKAL